MYNTMHLKGSSNYISLLLNSFLAPGTHIAQLSDMFPNHRFVCVDPAPFSPYLSSHDSLLLRQVSVFAMHVLV